MKFFHSKVNLFYFLISVFYFLKSSLVYSQTLEFGVGTYNIIYIRNQIIGINDSENDYNIYYYNETKNERVIIDNYSDIKTNKNIFKMDDNYFLISGFDDSDNFIYIIKNMSDLNSQFYFIIDEQNIKPHNIDKYNILSFSEQTFFMFFAGQDNNFYIYRIDNGNLQIINIPDEISTFGNGYSKYSIQCESSNNGVILFCICIWKRSNNEWENKYFYYNSNYYSVNQICGGNCFSANIKKVDDSQNKYLICYESNDISKLSIKCNYYYIITNNIVRKDKEEFTELIGLNIPQSETIDYERPLFINIYNNSIFIENDFYVGGSHFAILFLSSLDFKITMRMNAIFSHISTKIFFNNDIDYYIPFYIVDNNQIKTKIEKKSFIECSNKDYFMIGNTQSIELDLFNNEQVLSKTIKFSLDTGNIIYKENNIYKLNKTIENGILKNYYSLGQMISDTFSSFSLICQINVIICYKTCKNCSSEFTPTSTVNQCTECDLINYFPIYIEKRDNPHGFNCYSLNDDKISQYYLYEKEYFMPCNDSCKSCNNSYSCNLCKDGYYFKAYKNNTIIFNDKCMNYIPDSYYLDFDANIKVENEIIKSVYKPCYKTCKSCNGPGNYSANSCTSCLDNYMQYEFNRQQCTTNYMSCINNKTYWKLENNNIICIPECNQSFIISGTNEGQCVENCENYINPFSIEQTGFLLSYQCNNSNYCIPYSDCFKGSFYVSDDGKNCERKKRCIKIDIFDENMDPFEIEPEEEIEEEPFNYDTKIENIYNRIKTTKILTDNKEDSEVLEMFFDTEIIEKYNTLLANEKSNIIINDIFLIISTRYINFTITIYPIDIEYFVYSQVIAPNNLGFINFTKTFPDYIYYEINTSNLILVCLLEYHNENSSINDLNYYLYSFNEKNYGNLKNLGEKIIFNETEEFNLNESSILETQYILYNYLNNSSSVNKRNSDYLVDNIKDFSKRYPEVQLYNISDSFYNDICFLFTTDQGTDMTLEDRRKEYYINASLCEDNCILVKIINTDIEPRSVCNCDIKLNISFNNNEKKDNLNSYSVLNIKSFICISETFNFNLKKNGYFWIFIIVLVFQVYLLIIYIKHRENIINKMLGLFEANSSVNKQLIASSSDGSSNFSYEYKKNEIKVSNNKEISNISNDKIESQQEEILSAPVNVSNPPKKKVDLRRPNNNSTKTDIKVEEKDLISGIESSIIKGSTIKYERNQQDFTDISFDDIQEEYNKYQIDNLLLEQKGILLKDNYLKDPILEEKNKKMKKIKKSLRPLGQKNRLKFSDSCEDLLYSNNNKDKFNNKKSKKITKILGGEEIFRNYLIENYSDNENKPRYPKTKIKNEEIFGEDKDLIGDEIFFAKIKANRPFLVDEGNNKNKIRITSNKNVEDLFEPGNNDKNTNNNTLAKSLGKKEINRLKEEGKNSEERILTEIDNNANNKIKEELQKISKENRRPYSSVGIFGKKQKKNGLSPSNNDLKKKNILHPLALKTKKDDISQKVNNIGNKDSSKVSGSRMLRFAEEDEIVGDQNVPNIKDEDEEKIKRKRSRNLELLKSKNFFTSMTELLETENKEILVEEHFILYYWKYFMRRELWLLTIINKKENIPYFIRYSSLAFCISFISLLNCFFFFESDIHRRYINAIKGKKNRIGFYFKNEFKTTIAVALIGNLFKMIIIKLVVYKLFKIGKNTKKMMKASSEIGLTQEEIEELHLKRLNYLKRYKLCLMIYFICLMALNILFAYICICYAGVFYNSQGAFLYGLLFSLIFSFIFCAIICLLIVSLYRLGKYLKSKCTISAYIVLSTLY